MHFYSKIHNLIDKLILSLKDEFLLEREDDMAGFLGIKIARNKDNDSLTMTQTGLIERILAAMEMEDYNLKYTPTDKDPLHKDQDGDPCCESWDYRSIVGMMLYLAGSTRPNITYTVHQCARFSHIPRRSHEIGVKHIARYLNRTHKKRDHPHSRQGQYEN